MAVIFVRYTGRQSELFVFMRFAVYCSKRKPFILYIFARMAPRGRCPFGTICVTILRLSLCWHSVEDLWMNEQVQVCLVVWFPFHIPMSWVGAVLPLPYGQIRIINWSNSSANLDIWEQGCYWNIFENRQLFCHFTKHGKKMKVWSLRYESKV